MDFQILLKMPKNLHIDLKKTKNYKDAIHFNIFSNRLSFLFNR